MKTSLQDRVLDRVLLWRLNRRWNRWNKVATDPTRSDLERADARDKRDAAGTKWHSVNRYLHGTER